MPRGGKRAGAGRKKGSATRKTREVADRAALEGVTPLEVMLSVMRRHYEAERWGDAAGVARDAAPYMHPRLTTTTLKGSGDDGEVLLGIAFINSPPANGPDETDA